MAAEAKKKVEFIVAWYNKERVRFSFVNQVKLAKTWIDICTKNEEYEMAAALKKEMERVIKNYIDFKRKSRSIKQKMRYFWIKFKRKITFR